MENGEVGLTADLSLDPVCGLKASLKDFVESFESSVVVF